LGDPLNHRLSLLGGHFGEITQRHVVGFQRRFYLFLVRFNFVVTGEDDAFWGRGKRFVGGFFSMTRGATCFHNGLYLRKGNWRGRGSIF